MLSGTSVYTHDYYYITYKTKATVENGYHHNTDPKIIFMLSDAKNYYGQTLILWNF